MTAAENNNDSNTSTIISNKIFYKGESRLFHADIVTNNTTGVKVKISNELEKLYNYMLNQYLYRQSHGQRFAESKERLGTIARIGDPRKNTKAHLDRLIALGLVEIIGKVARCDVYKVNLVDNVDSNLSFNYKSVNGEVTYDHSARIGTARAGVFTPAAAPATTSAQPTSATIQDLIDEILKYERDSDRTLEAVREVVEDEIKKSSYYDDPMKYKKKKEAEQAWNRFNIQVQQVIGRLAEMALEHHGLDAPVRALVAESLRYYQEELEEKQKSEEKQEDGKSEMQAEKAPKQAAAADESPVDQVNSLAAGSTAPIAEQQSSVASNDDNGGNDGTDGDHAVSQVGEQEDPFPWKGDTFIKNRLSENAYQWALTAGATDWRHACCLVWEKIELTPPTEIDEHFKPLSLC